MIEREKQYSDMPYDQKVRLLAHRLFDKQANEIMGLQLKGISTATDAMLLATAKTQRHAQALADAIGDAAKEANLEYLGMEGYKAGQWVLIDLNDVLVHIFIGEMRRLFNLEGLWLQAPRMELSLPDPATQRAVPEGELPA